MPSAIKSVSSPSSYSNECNSYSNRESMMNSEMNDIETLNNSKCENELLSIHKLPLHERYEHKNDNSYGMCTKLSK
ncbi:unnamed protein product [Heterobilharzia americana]|nr:unnamed protein product [Heterobilharzia americana]